MFLYLSWQDVVSFRVASVASITSNPSVVELSVDDPLSPIFEEETPDIATSVLQSDFPSGDGCSVAAVLPPVATVQTNFQQRKEEGGKSERTDRSEFLGEDEWFGGGRVIQWFDDGRRNGGNHLMWTVLGKFDGKEMLMVYSSVFWGEEKEEKEIFIAKIVCRRSHTAIKNQKI